MRDNKRERLVVDPHGMDRLVPIKEYLSQVKKAYRSSQNEKQDQQHQEGGPILYHVFIIPDGQGFTMGV